MATAFILHLEKQLDTLESVPERCPLASEKELLRKNPLIIDSAGSVWVIKNTQYDPNQAIEFLPWETKIAPPTSLQ